MSDGPALSRRQLLRYARNGAIGYALAGASAPLLAADEAAPTSAPAKPTNFLLVMSDEHHPTVTGAHGHPLVHTPNLQKLAARGTVYDNTYCCSPLCSPCRSAFVSGQRTHQLQWYNNCNVFERNDATYGAVLKDQGVHSVFIGKTDVYEQSAKMGFSEVFVPVDRKPPGDTFMQRNPLAIRKGALQPARGSAFGPHDDPFHGDDLKITAALKWLKETAPAVKGPWTLNVDLNKPHFPHFVTKDLWDQYEQGADLPKYGRDEPSANHPRALDLRAHFETDQFTDGDIRGLRRGYLGCVSYVDQQLGKLIDALAAIGQLENTVIAYTSDHGDMLGKFGLWWKCSLYDDSARVPLIVAGPGFTAGQRVKTPVELHDLQASIFQAVGVKRPGGWVGSPLQTVKPNDPDRIAFSEYHGHGTRASSFLVRRGDMKLIYHVNAPHQLFDLANDPEELHNLYADRPAVAKDLENELRKICDPEKENARAEELINKQAAATAARPKNPNAD